MNPLLKSGNLNSLSSHLGRFKLYLAMTSCRISILRELTPGTSARGWRSTRSGRSPTLSSFSRISRWKGWRCFPLSVTFCYSSSTFSRNVLSPFPHVQPGHLPTPQVYQAALSGLHLQPPDLPSVTDGLHTNPLCLHVCTMTSWELCSHYQTWAIILLRLKYSNTIMDWSYLSMSCITSAKPLSLMVLI